MSKEFSKLHIRKMPVTQHPQYKQATSNKLAVSIPLFYSTKDSGVMTNFDFDDFKVTQVKGAVWAAIALHNNTDLVDKGVGIYFHIEDKVADVAAEVLNTFDVPKEMIKVRSLNAPEPNIEHTQYGKKLMCLDDTEITPERWLILDTDAFVCSPSQQLLWYDKLASLNVPATLNFNKNSTTTYEGWVRGLCVGVGIPFDPNSDLFKQEQRAFYKVGFQGYSDKTEALAASRPFVASQMTLIPTAHSICPFLKEHYKTCYQDEFLMGLWDIKHNEMVSLSQYIRLPTYYYVDDYLGRDIAKDVEGYLVHFHHKDTEKLKEQIDNCYKPFFTSIEYKKAFTSKTFERISDKLQHTTSDKHCANGHKYGMFYDMLFDSVAKRLDRKLRICEVGVSFFGEGSLKAFQELDNVEQVVGIDILPYEGKLLEHAKFYKVEDAYTHQTIKMLKNNHAPFDIIIDDGSHDPIHQEFFMKNYYQLLAAGGSLVCEDIHDSDFFKKMCLEDDILGFDGWANRGKDKNMTDLHNERLLVREKREDIEIAPATLPKSNYIPQRKIRFHLLGIAYGATHIDFSACAFVQKTRKGSNMLHNLGGEVIHYGHENSEINCTEHVNVIDDFVLEKTYGTAAYNGAPGYNVKDLAFSTFNINTERALRKRVEPGDFVLGSFPHQTLYERISDLPVHFVEWGIGYSTVYSENKVYESLGWQMFHRGIMHAQKKLMSIIPDWRSAVIPNYFDPDEFEYKNKKEDYIFYLGRIDKVKGIDLVLEVAKRSGTRVVLAGQNKLGDELYHLLPENAEYVGILNSAQRNYYLANAKVVICPSLYLEPFLGVHIEAGFCGTPIITTNWGAPAEYCQHGVTGYRCQTGEHMLWALENIDKIKSIDCYNWAYNNFSTDRVSISYHEYFNTLYRNINGFFWDRDDTRTDLDWLRTNMTTDEITERVKSIQVKSIQG